MHLQPPGTWSPGRRLLEEPPPQHSYHTNINRRTACWIISTFILSLFSYYSCFVGVSKWSSLHYLSVKCFSTFVVLGTPSTILTWPRLIMRIRTLNIESCKAHKRFIIPPPLCTGDEQKDTSTSFGIVGLASGTPARRPKSGSSHSEATLRVRLHTHLAPSLPPRGKHEENSACRCKLQETITIAE